MGVSFYRGSWKAEIWINHKKVKTRSGFKTKKKAKDWHDTNRELLKANPDGLDKVQRFKFEELVQKYREEHLPTLKATTVQRYEIDLKYRIEPFFKFMPLEKINVSLISSFRAKVIGEGLKDKSINNCCAVLRSLLQKAVDWEMIKKSPYRLEDLTIPDDDYLWWDNKDDIARFLKLAESHQYYAAFRLALDLGLRLGEVVGLSKRDINFVTGLIHVRRQWLDKQKRYGVTKSGKQRWIRFDPNSEFALILRKAVDKSPDAEMIFVTRNGKRLLNRNLSGQIFPRLVAKAGV